MHVRISERERLRQDRGDAYTQVDAIEQRSRDAQPIARDAVLRAMTASAGVSQPSAGTGIHRGHELELRGKRALPRSARDVDHAGLERLPQCLEHAALPLGKFVQEQHTKVSQ